MNSYYQTFYTQHLVRKSCVCVEISHLQVNWICTVDRVFHMPVNPVYFFDLIYILNTVYIVHELGSVCDIIMLNNLSFTVCYIIFNGLITTVKKLRNGILVLFHSVQCNTSLFSKGNHLNCALYI